MSELNLLLKVMKWDHSYIFKQRCPPLCPAAALARPYPTPPTEWCSRTAGKQTSMQAFLPALVLATLITLWAKCNKCSCYVDLLRLCKCSWDCVGKGNWRNHLRSVLPSRVCVSILLFKFGQVLTVCPHLAWPISHYIDQAGPKFVSVLCLPSAGTCVDFWN